MPRTPNPRSALDFPNLDDALFIIWHANEHKWPDARRRVSYLTDRRTDALRGYALFTGAASEAKTFKSEAEARAWLVTQDALRGRPCDVTVSTVSDMKDACGYTP